jgi:hypothetical protein
MVVENILVSYMRDRGLWVRLFYNTEIFDENRIMNRRFCGIGVQFAIVAIFGVADEDLEQLPK